MNGFSGGSSHALRVASMSRVDMARTSSMLILCSLNISKIHGSNSGACAAMS
jgi:hypothetical protein